MADRSLQANPWYLAATPRISWHSPLDNPNDLSDWLPATVPGTIQRDLMVAGRLPDLYQLLDPGNVLAEVDNRDWWYRTELAGIAAEERAWLRFEGIDYLAAITLAGKELERRAGMYARRQYEVSKILREGEAMLGVRVWGGDALPQWPSSLRLRLLRTIFNRIQSGLPAFDNRLLTLKAPLHFGWDFAPRLLAAGIWDEVTLHIARGVGLLDVWARADWGEDFGLILRLELDADQTQKVQVQAVLTPTNFSGKAPQTKTWPLSLETGQQLRYLTWRQARLQPWHSHDRGFPHLYHLQIRILSGNDGKVLDETAITCGARTLGWERGSATNQASPPLYLNGERLPLRGINWVPLDLLSGDPQTSQRYRTLLEAAVAAGVNAVRVWGGGGREKAIFYELCDELGLLVWQEMPIACVFFDHLPEDTAFLALVEQEMRGIMRRLRGHPSLMMWGGGNEWGPGRHRRLTRKMNEIASQEDPSRRWVLASPGPGDSHNWQVWHGKASPLRYAQDPAPLLSEFGHSAAPPLPTLRQILPPKQLWPPSAAWISRKAEPAKLWHYAIPFLPPDSLPQITLADFVAASQQAQARALQIGMEAYRLREDAVGSFIWQWNEPWPAICWSVWPYQGAPKPAYAQIARSYAPLAALAQLQDDRASIWLVNDTLTSPGPCTLTVRLDDRLIWQESVTPTPGRQLITTIAVPADARRLGLELVSPDQKTRNDYDLVWWRLQDQHPPGWRERLRLDLKHWLLRW